MAPLAQSRPHSLGLRGISERFANGCFCRLVERAGQVPSGSSQARGNRRRRNSLRKSKLSGRESFELGAKEGVSLRPIQLVESPEQTLAVLKSEHRIRASGRGPPCGKRVRSGLRD